MANHPKDRHVRAAAVRADAEVIVTFNLKDFPDSALKPYDLEAVHPDAFLLAQLDLYPGQPCALWTNKPRRIDRSPSPYSDCV